MTFPVSKLPRALQKQMKWKMSTITPNVVKNVIARTGFVPSTSELYLLKLSLYKDNIKMLLCMYPKRIVKIHAHVA